jgi:hypothetical protein
MMKRNFFSLFAVCILPGLFAYGQEQKIPALPDLSGLQWIEGDRFLAIHDSKNPKQSQRPRVSIIRLPRSPGSIEWKPLTIEWPQPLGPSSDMESIARIPQTQSFLLVESGERLKDIRPFRRVFHVELRDDELKIVGSTELPDSIINIEGAAVVRAGSRLFFIYAERAHGKPYTDRASPNRSAPQREVQPGGFHRIRLASGERD